MGEKKCIGCKVYAGAQSCKLGYKIKLNQYSPTHIEPVALERCPRPTNFRHAKKLMGSKE